MTQVIDLSEYINELNLIERLQYETDARKEICAYMVDTEQNHTDAYQKYFEEYIQYRKAFDMEKNRFVSEDILKGQEVKNWRIDYATRTLTIEI